MKEVPGSLQEPHGVTPQKTFFIVTAVKTSNLTQMGNGLKVSAGKLETYAYMGE
jgi:hypothetical protein